MYAYTIKHIEDPAFWQALTEFPGKGKDYPQVLTLSEYGSFALAPASVMQCYAEFKDPTKALNFTVPPTPEPITRIVYLVSPQVGTVRRVFVALCWGVDPMEDFASGKAKAILAECSYIPLLHRPLGLRIANGAEVAVNRAFNPPTLVIKGDDAPIHMVLRSPNNPQVGVSFIERLDGEESVLDIRLMAPGLAAMTVNAGSLD